MPALQAALLAKESHNDLGKPCECGSANAKYRCRSCTHGLLYCQSCILSDHHLSAWHHLEEWVGTHFSQMSLYRLGYRLRLGHHGDECLHRSRTSTMKNMVIVHTNGLHHASVEFCTCNTHSAPPYQLIDADLFPATLEQPETAFTFKLLNSFQKLSLRSKINAYDYHRSLQEMTNAAFVQDVPVCIIPSKCQTELIYRVCRTDTTNLFVYIRFGTISLKYGDLAKATTLTTSWFIADKAQSQSGAPLALKFTSTLIKL
jgi:CxC2 like cysteine cluster associated with KDZ transposases